MYRQDFLLRDWSRKASLLVYRRCFLLLAVLGSLALSEALFYPPENARLEWLLEYTTTETFDSYRVEEFVDRPGQNIHLVVYDEKSQDLLSYIWIGQPVTEATVLDMRFVSFDHSASICSQSSLKFWLLRDLTRELEALDKFDGLQTVFMKKDMTAIGSTALLRVVSDNAKSFKGETLFFDESTLQNAMVFKIDFSLESGSSFRIVCVMPAISKSSIWSDIKKTSLADFLSDSFPSKIAIFTFDHNVAGQDLSSVDLLKEERNFMTRLVVNYNFVEKRSAYKHLGVKFSSFKDENPFKLPVGLGCSLVISQKPIRVNSNQFSGLMRVGQESLERFVAYDEFTWHLRIDVLGQHRLIYNMQDMTVTYIEDKLNEFVLQDSILKVNESLDDDICTAGMFNDIVNFNVSRLQKMEEVIGFGHESAHLMYLGYHRLEDGTNCMVYEREISPQQIPFLLRVHARSLPLAGRLFLTFYFVREFPSKRPGSSLVDKTQESLIGLDIESVWLKQIKLTSTGPAVKGVKLHAEITFSQFVWTLAAMAEQTDLEEQEHPARVFDTLVCSPLHKQFTVDVALFRQTSLDDVFVEEMISSKINKFEEFLVQFIAGRTGIARSNINQFSLEHDSSYLHDQENVIAHFKASIPDGIMYKRTIIGWTRKKDLDKEFSDYKTSLSEHEFMLKMAHRMSKEVKTNFYTIHCSYDGIARALKSLDDLNYAKVSEKSVPDQDENICKIYKVEKLNTHSSPIPEKYSKRVIEANLYNSKFSVDLNSQASGIYRASVVKATVTEGLDEYALGSVISSGECYTPLTTVIMGDDAEITQITLDPHLSVVTCHRACGLYMNCLTYSYDTKKRVCTLSNIRSVNFALEKEVNPDCRIYAPNSLYYYESTDTVYLLTPAALTFNHYMIKSNLETCANTCRQYELRQVEVVSSSGKKQVEHRVHCNSFYYMPSVAICAIYDPQSSIYSASVGGYLKRLPADFYRSLFSSEIWDALHSAFSYRRDNGRYFSITQATSIDGASAIDVPDIQQGPFKVVLLSKHDVSRPDECELECSMLSQTCVMFDYCYSIDLRRIRTCVFYMLADTSKAPQAGSQYNSSSQFDALQSAEFTATQMRYLLNLIQSFLKPDRDLLTRCQHYQLKEDYLVAKRAFAKASRLPVLIDQDESTVVPEPPEESDHLDSEARGQAGNEIGLAVTLNFCFILTGITIGILLSVYQPILKEKYPLDGISGLIVRAGSKIRRTFHRNSQPLGRSSSVLELNELEEATY